MLFAASSSAILPSPLFTESVSELEVLGVSGGGSTSTVGTESVSTVPAIKATHSASTGLLEKQSQMKSATTLTTHTHTHTHTNQKQAAEHLALLKPVAEQQ